MRVRGTSGFVCLSLAVLAACGSGSSTPASQGPYPAFTPNIGQIINHGGPLLTSAKIVTVTWTADPNESSLEDFDDKLGGSSFWKTILSGYGIGPATSGAANHVRVKTAPPASIEDTDLETWLVQQVTDPAKSGWPAWDSQTVYVVYVSTSTKLTTLGADACSSYASLHAEVAVGQNWATYVFVDENCNGSRSVLDGATGAASHEIAEAATNPHPFTKPAIIGFDAAHLAWGSDGLDGEIGDVCQIFTDAFYEGPSDLPYLLQRLWSNTSAAAGHNPCVPQSTEPYFNVTPLDLESLMIEVGTAQTPATPLGYRVPVGTRKTFNVGYYSDAPTGYWDIKVVEGDGLTTPSSSHLTLSVASGAAGLNGDQGAITVEANSAPSGGNSLGHAVLMTVVSSAPGHTTHYMPILIGTY
jgi:hypothetical protein